MRIAVLALMLVVSHLALTSHVTAHFEPDLEQCELCVSQAQLLCAVSSSDHAVPVDPAFGISCFAAPLHAVPVQQFLVRHQRAPPVPSD